MDICRSMGRFLALDMGPMKHYFTNAMPSDTFRAESSTLTLSISATTPSIIKSLYVRLMDGETVVDTAVFTANGTNQTHQYTGLTVRKKYYLYFEKHLVTSSISGSGSITLISLLY